LELNDASVCSDDVNLLGERMHMVKKNRKALLVIRKEISLIASAEKTKHMFTHLEQTAGQNQNIKIGDKSVESVVILNIWEQP
jgi:hypothetical protein